MAYNSRTFVDQINVLPHNAIGYRTKTVVEQDGVEIASTYHRGTVAPGESTDGLDARIVAIAAALWTPEVIEAYRLVLSGDETPRAETPDEWFNSQIAAGFTTSYGWKLGLTNTDLSLLTGAFVLAKEAHTMDLPIPAIYDTAGVPHTLSIEDLTYLMLAYGQYRGTLSAEYAARKTAGANNAAEI
jgi:hypothetical protein